VVGRGLRDAIQECRDEGGLVQLEHRHPGGDLVQRRGQWLAVERDWGADMSGQDDRLGWQLPQAPQRAVEQPRPLPGLGRIRLQVWPANAFEEEGIAGEERPAVEQVAGGLPGVAGRCDDHEPAPADLDPVPVPERRERVGDAFLRRQVERRTGDFGQEA
jgi:hypothetical protein